MICVMAFSLLFIHFERLKDRNFPHFNFSICSAFVEYLAFYSSKKEKKRKAKQFFFLISFYSYRVVRWRKTVESIECYSLRLDCVAKWVGVRNVCIVTIDISKQFKSHKNHLQHFTYFPLQWYDTIRWLMCPRFEFHAKISSSSIRCINLRPRVILFAHNFIIFASIPFFFPSSNDEFQLTSEIPLIR